MKRFNLIGLCVPEQHYMVDLTEKVMGYPFLVSWICKWIEERGGRIWTAWNVDNAYHKNK